MIAFIVIVCIAWLGLALSSGEIKPRWDERPKFRDYDKLDKP